MALATWCRSEQLPVLTRIEGFFAGPTEDTALLARLAHLEVAEVQKDAERFWIIAAPEHRASSVGIRKAGFPSIAHLLFQRSSLPGLIPMASGDRVAAAAALLQVPFQCADARLALSPCWHCAIDARQDGREVTGIACWPTLSITQWVRSTINDLTLTACYCA